MDEPREIALLSSAHQALAEAKTIDEVKDLRNKADAVRYYARQAKLGQELVIEAAVVKLRAERRIGQILCATPLATGVQGNQYDETGSQPNGVLLKDLGISKSDSSRMQRIAELDDSAFEDYIDSESQSQREPTAAGVMRLIRSLKPKTAQAADEPQATCKYVASLDELLRSGLRFRNILVNPLTASVSYELLESMPVTKLLEEDGSIHIWTRTETLLEALDLADAWELAYRNMELFAPPKNLMPEQSPHLLLRFQHESLQQTTSTECSWTICSQPEDDGVPLAAYRQIETSQPGLALAVHTQSLPQGENWTAYGRES